MACALCILGAGCGPEVQPPRPLPPPPKQQLPMEPLPIECVGTPLACSVLSSDACETQPGCKHSYTCESPCAHISNLECSLPFSVCAWDWQRYRCTPKVGTRDCSTLSFDECTRAWECRVKDVTCVGTPAYRCSELPLAQCCEIAGCDLTSPCGCGGCEE